MPPDFSSIEAPTNPQLSRRSGHHLEAADDHWATEAHSTWKRVQDWYNFNEIKPNVWRWFDLIWFNIHIWHHFDHLVSMAANEHLWIILKLPSHAGPMAPLSRRAARGFPRVRVLFFLIQSIGGFTTSVWDCFYPSLMATINYFLEYFGIASLVHTFNRFYPEACCLKVSGEIQGDSHGLNSYFIATCIGCQQT